MADHSSDSVAMAAAPEAASLTGAEERTEKLLVAARDGNELAFEELMRLYRTEVYRMALGMLGQPDQAADVSQDVFIRFYKALGRLRGSRRIRGWLRRVTINRCYDVLRHRKRQVDLDAEYLPACMAMMQGNTDIDTSQIAEAVQQCLNILPPRQRAALVLTCREGYSSAEAGKAMGCNPSTVRVLTHKARARLKALLLPDDTWGGI